MKIFQSFIIQIWSHFEKLALQVEKFFRKCDVLKWSSKVTIFLKKLFSWFLLNSPVEGRGEEWNAKFRNIFFRKIYFEMWKKILSYIIQIPSNFKKFATSNEKVEIFCAMPVRKCDILKCHFKVKNLFKIKLKRDKTNE